MSVRFGGVFAAPVAGAHYPRSLGELQSWFVTDADCLDYLEWLRWPDGFVCPRSRERPQSCSLKFPSW